MNKKVLLALAAGIVMLAACKKDNVGTGFSKKETVTATLPKTSTPTKTTLSGLQVVWGDDDAISVFAQDGSNITNNEGTISGGQGTTQATFDVVVEGTQKLAALYPYALTSAYDGEKMSINMKDTYAYVENGIGGAPMASLIKSSAQSAPITFKNAGALMGLTVNNIPAGYNKAILTSKGDEVIAGPCEITFDAEGNPTMVATASATGKEITITFDAASELTNKTFYFPIPVDDYSSLQLSISDGSNVKVLKTKALVAERSIRYKSTLTLDAVTGVIPTEVEGTAEANEALADGKTSLSVTVAEDETTPTITMPQGDVPTTLSFEPIPTGKVVTIKEGAEGNVTENLTIAASSEPTSSNSFEIIMPNSTVTLDANGEEAVYDEVTAHTAAQTLIVGEGVTINDLKVKGGNVRVYGEVKAISRIDDNADAVTYVIVEEGAVIPENLGENIVAVPVAEWVSKAVVTSNDELLAALEDSEIGTIILGKDLTFEDILVLDRDVILDGNNHSLTSTATRAINVNCAGEVTIQNITINASGERAINVIQKPVTLTIQNITATSANYTINVAGSAGAAKVAITNSTLNGLCTVNVASAGTEVVIDKCVVNCNDENTTPGESYAALTIGKEGLGAKIVATNTTINIAQNSDSIEAKISAEDALITINGSTENVHITPIVITYPGPYYHSFETLAAAVEFASDGANIALLRDIETSETINITKSVTIDGNGHSIMYEGAAGGRIIDVKKEYPDVDLKLTNITLLNNINNYIERGINYNTTGSLTLEDVIIKSKEGQVISYAINMPSSAKGAVVYIKNSSVTGNIALNIWGTDSEINVENSELYTYDTSDAEGYSVVKLNNDGINSAEGSVINITGGCVKTTYKNANDPMKSYAITNNTLTGEINVDNTTEVVGETRVTSVVVDYKNTDNFYSFTTLQAAINKAAENPSTVDELRLIRDLELAEPVIIPEGLSIVLNLNGYTLTTELRSEGVHYYAINNYGTLTLKGKKGSAINARGVQNFSAMTIEGDVTITNMDTNGGAAIWNEAELTVNGGTFTTNDQAGVGSYGTALTNTKTGNVIINGGNFVAYSQLHYAIVMSSTGTITINDAYVSGKHGAIANDAGSTIIKDGIFVQTDNAGVSDHCIYCETGAVTLYGGEYSIETLAEKNGGQVFCAAANGSIAAASGYKIVEAENGTYTVVKE